MTRSSTVRAVNALTARWAAVLPAGGTAFTTAGVWSLLALLADGATGAVRKELADAIGIPADNAADQARELLATIDAMPGVHSALGLWTHEALPIEQRWLAALPERVHGQLTGDAVSDQARLDAWAATCTEGQIPSMPVTVEKDTQLVLAGALTVRTDWIRPFTPDRIEAEAGPWRGKNLAGLFRVTALLNRVGVTQTPVGPVTVLDVLGTQGVDVHLFLGPEEASPGHVLTAAVRTLDNRRSVVQGDQLPYGTPGPGLTVERVPSLDGEPELLVETVPFTITARHDLLEVPELFGLRTATDRARGHFPGISAEPLAVGAAAQTVTATFGAHGFRSASVTALSVAGAGAGLPRYRYRVRRISARFDRPFGFLAVHRTSRLVLNAGWITEPDAFEESSWEW
ncbi:serpin family protein [Streptomyces sp. LS1784]|uniref:serpin family protein n=1 Tax=Streptomyces sp. LS1784 TaxID=2851533 RepID=UPI001CC9445C|nr:serpin family protein [Streptomyces sp. LS1784]